MGTAFGLGWPGTFAGQTTPWGLVPPGGQGLGNYSTNPQSFVQPLQHVLQSLYNVPYQLQQLLQLQTLQQYQIQQLLQLIPTQLQQLIQLLPQPIQQLPQGQLQPFGQATPGVPISQAIGGAFGAPYVPSSGLGGPYAGQQSHVM
jgi:hypothetical protein